MSEVKLSKEVCKKCWQVYNREWMWVQEDDVAWKECMVWCPNRLSTSGMISVRGIPSYCPYRLEHIVMLESEE